MCSIMCYCSEEASLDAFIEDFGRTESRGPDDSRVIDTGHGLMGFHRLSIMGLTPEGMQPFELDGSFAICNGELYGFEHMREELCEKGYRFESDSDCEILLPLYREYGVGLFSLLDAEFACIIYDGESQGFVAARDPIGIRPLYYGYDTRGTIVFASEPKNLVGLAREIMPFPPGHYYQGGHFVRYCDIAKVDAVCTDDLETACARIREKLTAGVQKRLVSDSKVGFLLSGGLDSTLALLVTTRAFDLLGLDRSGIIAVTMPGFGTTGRTYNNACSLANAAGAELREISIADSVRQHFYDIGHDESDHDSTYENAQARERTQILMDLSNQEGGLVVGTGDLSELALGWATYNGDHMSMYGVNASIPKTLVRHLVRYVADTCGDEVESSVLYDVLDTPVSPELLPANAAGTIAQQTEDLVGPYELHDFFIYQVLRRGFAPGKVYRLACYALGGSYDKATILKWLKVFYRRFFSQQFKRSCSPDGPKVGSVGVSPRGDLRMPSDALASLWLAELEELG